MSDQIKIPLFKNKYIKTIKNSKLGNDIHNIIN
jgi:hypothetical protein